MIRRTHKMTKRNERNDIDTSTSTRETAYTSGDDETITITSTSVTDHPLLDAIDLLSLDYDELQDHAIKFPSSSQETSAPLSSLAFKKRESSPSAFSSSRRRISWRQQHDISTNSARQRETTHTEARPPSHRHSTYDSRTKKKHDVDTITNAEQIIVQLKLELAEAKSEVECQSAKNDKLIKENERLNLRIKECEVSKELHQVTANSLEDATIEIQELLEENRRLVSQVDTIAYQNNELKNKLGLMTVSEPLPQTEEQTLHVSTSTLETCDESISSSLPVSDHSSQNHLRIKAMRSGSGSSLDHRASALALMSSFRTSIRRIASGDGPEQVSVDDLLWDDADTQACNEQQQE